jgi:hypothetical protein
MSTYYSILDWPRLPDDYHQELITYSNNIKDKTSLAKTIIYQHHELPAHIETWCREKFSIDYSYKVVLQKFSVDPLDVFNIPLHIDKSRTENIIYLLSPSGPLTQWAVNDQIVESVDILQFTWTKINVAVPHTVLNIDKERIGIAIFKPHA